MASNNPADGGTPISTTHCCPLASHHCMPIAVCMFDVRPTASTSLHCMLMTYLSQAARPASCSSSSASSPSSTRWKIWAKRPSSSASTSDETEPTVRVASASPHTSTHY